MKEKQLLAHVAELFDLPSDVAAGLPHLELLGNRELFIEKHGGILAYSQENIDINTGSLVVRVQGSGLKLLAMTEQMIRLGGKIEAVSFLT